MKKTLIVTDMQTAFISGSLANPDAEAIVNSMVEYILRYGKTFDRIVATKDTHNKNYLNTQEGKNLPIEHALKGTKDWEIDPRILDAINKCGVKEFYIVEKKAFGFLDWNLEDSDEIVVIGTCTDICVISNVLILKAKYPETKITVISNLCAGLTKEKHEAALEVMKSCQVNIDTFEKRKLEIQEKISETPGFYVEVDYLHGGEEGTFAVEKYGPFLNDKECLDFIDMIESITVDDGPTKNNYWANYFEADSSDIPIEKSDYITVIELANIGFSVERDIVCDDYYARPADISVYYVDKTGIKFDVDILD